jgi:DNA-binding MarR family transcriptional regulator
MPQSHVSETVARLRKQGTVGSFPDPADRRRTLVRVSARATSCAPRWSRPTTH